jgi:hypothetical protein
VQHDTRRPTELDRIEEGKGHLLLNIAKVLFLVGVLAAAWFFWEWVFAGK